MKNIFTDFNEINAIVNATSEFDLPSFGAIIGMAIDTYAAVHGMDAPDLASMVLQTVGEVNAELGAYRIA